MAEGVGFTAEERQALNEIAEAELAEDVGDVADQTDGEVEVDTGSGDAEIIRERTDGLVPQIGDKVKVGRNVFRITKIAAGVVSLRAGSGTKGKATHKLTTVATIDRNDDHWKITGELVAVGRKATA